MENDDLKYKVTRFARDNKKIFNVVIFYYLRVKSMSVSAVDVL